MSGQTIELPEASELLTAFRSGLASGQLTFQRCDRCRNAWLPPREHCPGCLSAQWKWEWASGRARVVSWVVYHRAYHPAFADRVPYNVVLVELDEGPRMISNVLGIGGADGLAVDAPLQVEFASEGDVPVARFRRAPGAA
jgi:uncharacterized OB-fold protein